MRIQKLKIHGFKSFAQKTEILFEGNGITAIVGPNGCGKSNIVDSIRWVMGTQSANSLRMEKMQGVIFSGTQDRPAMNMAEVSLIIENDRGLLPSEYSEVMITRRVFGSGDSEYLINNQECRLADIRNLFADTGMGANSYSIMDQRMVDALLSDKADERRTVFEEAAGVSKYKKQRKETVARLEKYQIDSEAIALELQYVKKQFLQQERLLARAQELRKLRSRLKELDVSINLGKYAESKALLHKLSETKTKGDIELERLNTRITELEAKIAERQLLIASDEENLRECEKEVSVANAEIAKLNEAYIHLQNREKELEENKTRCEQEIGKSESGILVLKNEMQILESESKELAPEIEEIEKREEKESDILQSIRNLIEDLRIKHREFSNKRLQSVQAEGKLKNLWQKTDTEIALLNEQLKQTAKEIQSYDSQLEESAKLKENKDRELEENKNKAEILYEQQTVLANEKENLAANSESLSIQKMEALSRISRLEANLEALQSINENSGDLTGNKQILNQKAAEGAVLLSSQIEVADNKHAALVEFCLGFSVQAVLLQNQKNILECVQNLDNENLGRALLAWNPDSYEENVSLNEPKALPVSALVKFNENSGTLLKSLLSKYFLVEDLETAISLANIYAGKDFWFCTQDCQAVSSIGIAKIGKEQKENYGILQRNAELKNFETSLNEERKKADLINSQIFAVKEKLQEINIQVSNIAEEMQFVTASIAKANSEAEAANAKISVLKIQKENTEQEILNFEARLQALKESGNSNVDINAAELELEQVEREFERIDSRLIEQEQLLKNQEESVAEITNSLTAKKSVLSQKESRSLSVKEQIRTMNSSMVLRQDEFAAISGKIELLQRELQDKAVQIEKQYEFLAKKEESRDIAKEKYSVMAGDMEEWRSELREINRSLREKEKNTHELELNMQASAASLEKIRERIFQEYEFDLEKEPVEQNFTPLQLDEREFNVEVHELREKIKAIGPINITVAEDFEMERQKMLSKEAQYNDINEAKEALTKAIKMLDNVARDRFLDTFRKIQRNFQEVFSSLMPGGEALLSMQSDLDPLEAEIEINARPTGKKMQGATILSTGERALTAVALLFAIYMVKPSPYCILDELDGPLDDANIRRFMQLLRRFSHQTQFVVITHNKSTMAASDRLYGVSQEIKGISKVGSVRFEDFNG